MLKLEKKKIPATLHDSRKPGRLLTSCRKSHLPTIFQIPPQDAFAQSSSLMVPSTNNLYFWSDFFFFFKKQKHNFLAWTGSSHNKQHLTWPLIYFVLFPSLCDSVVGLGSPCPMSYLLASHPVGCWASRGSSRGGSL